MAKHSVLFVCWGNICRSPIAEAIFRDLVKQRGCSERWLVDSAGTIDMHAGNHPDERAQDVLHRHGLSSQHAARIITRDDFKNFEFILYMDRQNKRDLESFTPDDATACVRALGYYGLGSSPIADPYYGGGKGFETVFSQCLEACSALLDSVDSSS